jgi:ABC-type lipoprotein export system ATPase subunit
LEAREVSRVYHAGANTVHALSGVSMELHEGRMIVIGGRSGSGKTTYLTRNHVNHDNPIL